jgi:hypothetical protein
MACVPVELRDGGPRVDQAGSHHGDTLDAESVRVHVTVMSGVWGPQSNHDCM